MDTERERNHALYWLARLFLAKDREGGEEGLTEEEVKEHVLSVLDNACIGPYIFPLSLRDFLVNQEAQGHLHDVGVIGDIEEMKRKVDTPFLEDDLGTR